MRMLTRGAQTGGAGFIRTLALAVAVGIFGRLEAMPEADKSWQIRNELIDRQTLDREKGKTTETQKISNESRVCSNAGDEISDIQRNEVHPDGSTEDYQWIFIRDEDGTTGNIESVTETDPAGNYRVHSVTIVVDPYGERSTETEDSEFDSHGRCKKPPTENVTRDRVFQPYWMGSVTITTSLDDMDASSSDSFGIGRNQLAKTSSRHTIKKVIKALLLPPKHPREYGSSANVTEAQIEGSLKDVIASDLTATQELWCDGQWRPWRHLHTGTMTDEASGSGQGVCGVYVEACTGKYEISFSAPAMQGTHTEVETDSITAGKCWGSHNYTTPSSTAASFHSEAVDLRGTVGVKRGDELVGQTVTQSGKATVSTSWHLNLVTQAKPGAPMDE